MQRDIQENSKASSLLYRNPVSVQPFPRMLGTNGVQFQSSEGERLYLDVLGILMELPDSYLEYSSYMIKNSKHTVKHMENTASHCHRFVRHLHTLGLALDITEEKAWDAGLYHDMGKFFMLDIINAPRKLTAEEYEIVKTHPARGIEVITKYMDYDEQIWEAIEYHHESYSGRGGYMKGLSGDEIPLIARIVCVCDIYEALYSKRAYKTELPYEQVKVIMDDMKDKFDPTLFKIFFDMMDERIFGDNKRSS